MTREEILKIAAEALKTTVEEIEKCCKEVPEINGYYFWQNMRGGNSVMINDKGERLRATSSVSFEPRMQINK